MDDIAAELGLSKSTVSRALSGSGRIGAETVRRVKECADAHGFRPNLVAKALAGQRTLNLAAVMPVEATAAQMMFFHECLSGMVTRAAESGYSVLVCMAEGGASLEDVLHNRKADAVVLTQLMRGDRNVALLRQEAFPFVVIGSGAGAGIPHIDSKMSGSCAEFTRLCAAKIPDGGKILFVCGSLDIAANNSRLSGFLAGMEEAGIGAVRYAVCTDSADLAGAGALDGWALVLCSDDVVCLEVVRLLRQRGADIGGGVLVASFHDSVLLELSTPPVSALHVDAAALGATAVDVALRLIAGEAPAPMSYVGCSFRWRASMGGG